MIITREINEVLKIRKFQNGIVFLQNGNILFTRDEEEIKKLDEDVYDFKVACNRIIYNKHKPSTDLFIRHLDGNIECKQGKIGIRVAQEVSPNIFYTLFIAKEETNEKAGLLYDFAEKKFTEIGLYYLVIPAGKFRRNEEVLIKGDEKTGKDIWQVDIKKMGTAHEWSSAAEDYVEVPNSIHGELAGYKDLVIVPTRGGSFVALNAADGSVAWETPPEYWSFYYTLFEDKIFTIDKKGESLIKIDAGSGLELLKVKTPKLIVENRQEHLWGPVHVFEDIVVLHVTNESLAIYDSKNFTFIELIHLPGIQCGSSFREDIIWLKGRLYIRDPQTNILYIMK